ncbi:pyocin knob domain-containing protein [Acetoanaerobium noterae]|uniref:pyocin knob domain-containing protein n=1 Tax=Acetoanaerobium noterae TaxID=745369 RepID=UPI003342E01A
MENTVNYNLKKPGQDDFYNVADFNSNADIIDGALKNHDVQLEGKVSETDLDQLVSAESILTKIKTVDGASSGLDADLLDGKHATDFVNAIAIGSNSDPNTTLESYILSNHANSPSSAYYWHIQTLFYSTKAINSNRVQIATSYNSDNNMYIRRYFNNAWSAWTRLAREGDYMPILSNLRLFQVSVPQNAVDYTLFSYSGGPGRVTSISHAGYTKFSFVIDGVTIPATTDSNFRFGFGGLYYDREGVLVNIEFKQSIVIKANQTTAATARGVVLTEK